MFVGFRVTTDFFYSHTLTHSLTRSPTHTPSLTHSPIPPFLPLRANYIKLHMWGCPVLYDCLCFSGGIEFRWFPLFLQSHPDSALSSTSFRSQSRVDEVDQSEGNHSLELKPRLARLFGVQMNCHKLPQNIHKLHQKKDAHKHMCKVHKLHRIFFEQKVRVDSSKGCVPLWGER